VVIEAKKGFAFTSTGKMVRLPDMDGFFCPREAMPDEIVEAKIDGRCPRCDRHGDFGEEGLCMNPKCGFSY
jgi:hypothetical protein